MAHVFASAPDAQGPVDELPQQGMRKVKWWCIIIAVGGFLFGFDTGVISGALLFIKAEFGLNAFEQGTVVSVLLLGAMAGALGIGRLSDRWGRRMVYGAQGVVFLIGTALAVFAQDYWMLIASRFILGLAVGAASATVPVYISEMAPTSIRGRMLTLNQLMITIGILIAYFVNLAFAGLEAWRGMIGAGAVPALVMIAGALWLLPESPEWHLNKGREDAARKVLASVSDDATAKRLIQQRVQNRKESERSKKEDALDQSAGWRVLLADSVRPALIVGLTLAAVQQFGGINTIIYYAPSIMQQTGLSASNSIFYSIAIGVINLVMTIVAVRLIDRAGRRVLLLVSMSAMTLTLALLGLSFVAGWNPVVSLVFMVLYIAAFAVGLGPIFWTLIGEIFPPSARASGSGVSTAVNWASNFVLSLVFLTVVNAIGQGQAFWIFGVVCAFGVWFIARYVPETRGRDFGEVDAALQQRFHRAPTDRG